MTIESNELAFPSGNRQKLMKTLNYQNLKISGILSAYTEEDYICDAGRKDLLDCLYRAEQMCLMLRSGLEDQSRVHPVSTEENDTQFRFKDLPVSIHFEKETLRIFAPYTFSRPRKEAVCLGAYVRAAFARYRYEHPEVNVFMSMDYPLITVMKRRTKKYSSRTCIDNDNIEASRIVNEIFTVIGYSDNCLINTVISTFELSEEEGVEFIVFPKKRLSEHCSEL